MARQLCKKSITYSIVCFPNIIFVPERKKTFNDTPATLIYIRTPCTIKNIQFTIVKKGIKVYLKNLMFLN